MANTSNSSSNNSTKKSSSSSKTTRTYTAKTNVSVRSVLNFLSYVAVFCIGVALILQFIFQKVGGGGSIASAFQMVAQCLAYSVVSIYAFFFARTKRNIWYLICWLIAVILIIIFIIL